MRSCWIKIGTRTASRIELRRFLYADVSIVHFLSPVSPLRLSRRLPSGPLLGTFFICRILLPLTAFAFHSFVFFFLLFALCLLNPIRENISIDFWIISMAVHKRTSNRWNKSTGRNAIWNVRVWKRGQAHSYFVFYSSCCSTFPLNFHPWFGIHFRILHERKPSQW